MTTTLVLNTDGSPVSLLPITSIDWKDAINLMISEQGTPISYYDWEVHSPSLTLRVPSVIMLNKFIKFTRHVTFCRDNVYLRDDFTCQYCMNKFHPKDLSLDHVIPRFLGGKTTFSNIVTSCNECNHHKAHYTTLKPKTKPRKPSYYDLVKSLRRTPITIPSEDWIDYIGWDPNMITVKNPEK